MPHDITLESRRGYQLFLLILLQNEMVIREIEEKGKEKPEAYVTGTNSVLREV